MFCLDFWPIKDRVCLSSPPCPPASLERERERSAKICQVSRVHSVLYPLSLRYRILPSSDLGGKNRNRVSGVLQGEVENVVEAGILRGTQRPIRELDVL
jgi:hypothetical protein